MNNIYLMIGSESKDDRSVVDTIEDEIGEGSGIYLFQKKVILTLLK